MTIIGIDGFTLLFAADLLQSGRPEPGRKPYRDLEVFPLSERERFLHRLRITAEVHVRQKNENLFVPGQHALGADFGIRAGRPGDHVSHEEVLTDSAYLS